MQHLYPGIRLEKAKGKGQAEAPKTGDASLEAVGHPQSRRLYANELSDEKSHRLQILQRRYPLRGGISRRLYDMQRKIRTI